MIITVKTLQNKRYDLEIDPKDTISKIKQRIHQYLNLPEPAAQKLIRHGRILKHDDETAEAAGFKEGDSVVVMIRKVKRKPIKREPVTSIDAKLNDTIANLMGMGFERQQVINALRAANNNADRAVEYLINGIPHQHSAPQVPPSYAPTDIKQRGSKGNMSTQQSMVGGMIQQGMQGMIQQNPQMMAAMVAQLAQQNPQLSAAIQQNPQALQQTLQDPNIMQQLMVLMSLQKQTQSQQGNGGNIQNKQKPDKNDKIEQELAMIKNINEELRREIEEKSDKLIQEKAVNDNLQKMVNQLRGRNDELNNRNNSLLNELQETKIAHNNLQEMLARQRQENEELNVLKNRFQDECNGITMKYNALKIKYDKQQKKVLLNKDFTEWDSNDIIQWICSIEKGRYNKYESTITDAIKQENISGADLMDIDKNDLHRFGIKDFGDKKRIICHIQNLNANNKQVNDKNDIEGGDATIYH